MSLSAKSATASEETTRHWSDWVRLGHSFEW
jgi:hypothetical protein